MTKPSRKSKDPIPKDYDRLFKIVNLLATIQKNSGILGLLLICCLFTFFFIFDIERQLRFVDMYILFTWADSPVGNNLPHFLVCIVLFIMLIMCGFFSMVGRRMRQDHIKQLNQLIEYLLSVKKTQ